MNTLVIMRDLPRRDSAGSALAHAIALREITDDSTPAISGAIAPLTNNAHRVPVLTAVDRCIA